VVCRLSVAEADEASAIVADVDAQVGAEVAPSGPLVTEQVSVTVPVKPPAGVRVMVEGAVAPGLAIVTAVAEMVSEGTGGVFTVT